MSANTLESWANFFTTAASVLATLAGLLIVAVSVNMGGVIVTVMAAVLNAWVFLIEVLR